MSEKRIYCLYLHSGLSIKGWVSVYGLIGKNFKKIINPFKRLRFTEE